MASEIIQRLRGTPGVRLNEGILPARLAEIQAGAGLSLPEELAEFYLSVDGCDFVDEGPQFFSLHEADEMRGHLEAYGIKRSWRYWPLTENNDSNPFCICCVGELRGYVVQVFHDDGPQIKWTGFNRFLAAVLDAVEAGECDLEFMDFELQDSKRSVRDLTAGRALVEQSRLRPFGDVERDDLCRFAAWLFERDQTAEIASLLESEDEYVRRDICRRLESIPANEARRVVKEYQKSFSNFVRRCAEILAAAGLRAEVDQHTQLHLSDGPVCLNMDAFYNERARSDFDSFFVERAKQILKSKQEGKVG